MQVTLKKAAELSRAALAASKAIEPKSTITLSSFSTAVVQDVIAEGRKTFNDALARSVALVNAAYEIRDRIAPVNDETGVTKLLTKVAAIDETILRYIAATGGKTEPFSAEIGTETDDMDALLRRVEQARKDVLTDTETRRYGGREEIKIALLGSAEKQKIADEIGVLKRKRASFKDEITGLNFSTKIDLSDATVSTLRAEKLID